MADNLTIKQEAFVQALVRGNSQRESYKVAGYSVKSMKDTAIDVEACKLLATPKVSQRYNEIMQKVIQQAEDESIITKKEVLQGLAHIAKDDIKNYLSFCGDDDGNIIVKLKNSDDIDTSNISEISIGKDGQFKFKLYCKDNALVQLGKHLGMFANNGDTEGDISRLMALKSIFDGVKNGD